MPIDTIYSGFPLTLSTGDFATYERSNVNRLLSKTVEQQSTRSRGSTIKPKYKFIQIVVQIRRRRFPLMRSNQPSLQQRSHMIGQRQQIFTNFGRLSNNRTGVTTGGQAIISFPAISTDLTFGLNTLFDRWNQTGSRSALDLMETDAAGTTIPILNRHKHKRFASSPTTSFARSRATNIGFINLHRVNQLITARTNHRLTQFMHHQPCCLITLQSQNSFQSQGADSILLTDYLPDSFEPHSQGKVGILENRSSRNRNSIFALPTMKLPSVRFPSFFVTATRTNKSFWPSKLIQIFSTRFFRSKVLFKFKHRLRIVFHRPYILHLGSVGVNWISLFFKKHKNLTIINIIIE